jgi:PIN domain nuclease of toxin-antitoxin system
MLVYGKFEPGSGGADGLILTAYVTDTDALLRYNGLGGRRLPRRVRRILQRSEAGTDAIVVPIIVAWETALLAGDGVISLRPSFAAMVGHARQHAQLRHPPH